jgi:hypothetical protein
MILFCSIRKEHVMFKELLAQANRAPLMAEGERHFALAAMKYVAAGFAFALLVSAPLVRIAGA